MSCIPGVSLESVWPEMSEERRKVVCDQLKTYVSQLSNIPKPPECKPYFACSCLGGPLSDVQGLPPREFCGPFTTDLELRKALADAYYANGGRFVKHKYVPEIIPTSSASVFAHGDLAARNILVDDDDVVTGIIDWEGAVFCPDYWDFIMSYNSGAANAGFYNWIPEFIQPNWFAFTGMNNIGKRNIKPRI
eukprot:Phypoly_transcript_14395.p1 GENE.Phypoly_transcript_14395~~Phypoly_transcript_14395.p1  ORF type:complete len:191 (+),score=12.67 Phypoly_transcript_14395:375-947(+)